MLFTLAIVRNQRDHTARIIRDVRLLRVIAAISNECPRLAAQLPICTDTALVITVDCARPHVRLPASVAKWHT